MDIRNSHFSKNTIIDRINHLLAMMNMVKQINLLIYFP